MFGLLTWLIHRRADLQSTPAQAPGFLRGGGEMGERIREFDGSKTPLSSFDHWSPALRTMVGILLVNRFPLLLWWRPDYVSIYNDAYGPILGSKHPTQALGLPVRECWAEIWPVLKPLIETPFSGGASTWMEDIELEIKPGKPRRLAACAIECGQVAFCQRPKWNTLHLRTNAGASWPHRLVHGLGLRGVDERSFTVGLRHVADALLES